MTRAKPPLTFTAALAAALGLGCLGGLALLNKKRTGEAEQRTPAEGRFITVAGIKLHYLDRGSGTPIVLLHGNGAMAADFTVSGLVDRLASSHRVLAFDRPGFGYSPRPRGQAWTARQQAQLIHDALTALAVERPIVLGHSWGTLVALELALAAPAAVAGLVLLSGYYYPDARMDVAFAAPQAVPVLGDILSHTIAPWLGKLGARRAIRKIFAPSAVPARFTAGFPLDLALRPGQLRAVASDTSQMIAAARATMPQRQALGMPIAILAGDGDEIVNTGEQSERLARELDRATLTVVPGAGHMIHYDAPDAIVAAIERLAAISSDDVAPDAVARLLAARSAVIFDIDGTLIDSVDLHAQAWQEAFRDFGHVIDERAIRSQIGKGGDQLMPVFLSERELREQGEALEKHRASLFASKYLPRVVAFPEVRALFERLRADGKELVLASSAKRDEIDVYKRIAGITDFVTDQVSADDVSTSKPHPEVFDKALAKLKIGAPRRAIVVGDSPYDAQAARKAGLQTIGLLCGGFPEAALRDAGCIALCKDPADLLRQYDRAAAAAAE